MRPPAFAPGPTLARIMTLEERMQYVADHGHRVVGGIILPILASATPNVRDVECTVDRLDPDQAIAALNIAVTRLMELHGFAPKERSRTGPALRREAERLVHIIRDGQNLDFVPSPFITTEETCVLAVMEAIMNATQIVAPADDEPKLTGDLRVAFTVFRKGCKLSTVQEAIARHLAYTSETGGTTGPLDDVKTTGPEAGGSLDDLKEPGA